MTKVGGKTASVALKVLRPNSDNWSEDDDAPQGYMAVRLPKALPRPERMNVDQATTDDDQLPEDWTVLGSPPGHETRFSRGTFKNQSFLDVIAKYSDQYVVMKKSKKLVAEDAEFVAWVDKFFQVDHITKEVKPLPPPTRPAQQSECEHKNLHHKGSSAQYIRTTCKDCGLQEQEERHVPTHSPEQCAHLHTDHRGSNKLVRKTYCTDCGEYVDSVAQTIHKQIEQLKSNTGEIGLEDAELLARVMNHDLVSAAEIRKTAEVFTHLAAKLEDGNYNLKDVTVMLLDSVDTSVEALRSAGLPPTAFMAVLPWLRTERQATHLRVVDPLTDPHIWAIADDGCNSCCHGELWRINAEEKWKNLGFKCYFRNKAPMSFDGAGSTQTRGKIKVPMALRLEENGLILPSRLSSHEIPKKVTPLLLSQALQAHLGMTKCVRRGSITWTTTRMRTSKLLEI